MFFKKWNINPKKVVKKGWVILAKESQIQPCGIDFTIDRDLTLEPYPKSPAVNILFQEYVKIPKNVGMDLILRSSHSRRGIFKASAFYEPNYGSGDKIKDTGATTGITLVNLSSETITFKKGDRIAQAIFHPAEVAYAYNGHYNQNVKNVESQYSTK